MKKVADIVILSILLCCMAANSAAALEFQITDDPADQANPAIYRDRIVWQDNRSGYWDIYLHNLTTNSTMQITNGTWDQMHPAIFEDRIVWQDNRADFWNIFLYDLNEENETQITNETWNQTNPAIYEDKIVWQDDRFDTWNIFVFELREEPAPVDVTPTPTPAPPLVPTYSIGDSVEMAGYNFTFNSARWDAGTGFSSPDPDEKWLALDCTIRNIDDEATSFSSSRLDLYDADGYQKDRTFSADARGDLDAQIGPGRMIRGEAAYVVDIDDNGPWELVLQPDPFTREQAIFQFSAADVQ
ncbi:MAG: DUF4352 domain-containing protein [Methanoculleus sp.]|nr:DUF4352 domain-containing protein [Methanoculleus sp.]